MPRSVASPGRLDGTLALAVQRRAGHPPVVTGARLLSAAGEHALAWFALTGAGALLDGERRQVWVRAGTAAFVAHGSAVVLKRVVRRRRPALEGLLVHGRTVSGLSFPSSHAASTTATAVALRPVVGPALLPVAVAMAAARVVLGVHYPSDVLAGSAIGAVCGGLATRSVRR